MRDLPKTSWAAAPLLVFLALGCQASGDGANPGTGSGSGTGAGGKGSAGTAGALNGVGGVEQPPTEPASLLPARIRRLADAEYEASVQALVPDAPADISADFIPDSRQSGFTLNEAQRVDPVFAGQLAAAATTLAATLRQHLPPSAVCANPSTGADACADSFIRTFGAQAYRRPLGDDEVAQLMIVFHAALDGGSYDEGIELTARAMLQSAGFLYLTEIGDGVGPSVALTPYELASSISYLVQGRPPSAALLEKAVAGELQTSEGRARVLADQNLQLFSDSGAQARAVRVIKEWLGTDKISETAKDSNIYPEYAGVQAAMEAETTQFVRAAVMSKTHSGGSLAELLGAGWSEVNAPLAKVYGVSAPDAKDDTFVQVDLPKRVGLLNQGAFLSVFAHAHETAPVLRGVAVMRRVACMAVASPVTLDMAIVPPVPDPSKTTRQRFTTHATPKCAVCHDSIDSFGFAFEGFDGMGKFRTKDNNLDVDSSVVIAGTDFDGSYADSNGLAKAMSTSAQVRECFARYLYRALAATSAPEAAASEDQFVKYSGLEKASSTATDANLIATISAFITNPAFAFRRAP